MSSNIIELRGVGKVYKRYRGPADRLAELILRREIAESFTALHPVDLDVRRGETIGIIGRNGSGKSTLLQIIAGVLPTTSGVARIRGRTSTLLELGSGFNPDFSGRENVFFSGSLAGLTRSAILNRFDEIVAFSDIGDFIDRPVREYSSGMFVRLAFAVAVHFDPDIMLIDEALAVGDVMFQQKCFERLREMQANGATLLFVSHDSGSIYRLCDRALLLERGHLTLDGTPREVIETYEATMIEERDVAAGTAPSRDTMGVPEITFEREVSMERVALTDANGAQLHSFVSEATIGVLVRLRFHRGFSDPHVGFKIRNHYGDVVFETNTYCMSRAIGPVESDDVVTVRFEFEAPLVAGSYTVTIGVADQGYGDGLFLHQLIYQHGLTPFVVLRNMESLQWSGVVNLRPTVVVARGSHAEADAVPAISTPSPSL